MNALKFFFNRHFQWFKQLSPFYQFILASLVYIPIVPLIHFLVANWTMDATHNIVGFFIFLGCTCLSFFCGIALWSEKSTIIRIFSPVFGALMFAAAFAALEYLYDFILSF